MKSITIVVVCVAFFVQVNLNDAKVPDIRELLQDKEYKPLSATARELVATMLDHIQTMLRNERAADALITVATNTEKVLTSQSGQDNIMAILDLVGFLLKDPNASKIITIWCDKADTLITTAEGRTFLRSMILSFHRVLSSNNVIGSAKALMDGIENYLSSLSVQQIRRGMEIVQTYAVDTSTIDVSDDYLQARDIQSSVDNKYLPTASVGPMSVMNIVN